MIIQLKTKKDEELSQKKTPHICILYVTYVPGFTTPSNRIFLFETCSSMYISFN